MSWNPSVIVVTSDEPYSQMWHTQLIYTEYLAENYQVFYIDSPAKWTISNIFSRKKKPVKIHAGLKVIKYRNLFPSFIPFLQSLNEKYNDGIIAEELRKAQATDVLFWHFDSYRSALCTPVLNDHFNIKRVYHVIDPFYYNPLNQLLCQLSDLIIITSQRHALHYSEYGNKLLHIPQVLNIKRVNEFLQNNIAPNVPLQKPYIVLLGTLSESLDYDWLIFLAENLKMDLHLIGQVLPLPTQGEKFKRLLAFRNIIPHGVMSQEKFYPVIAGALAGLAIYDNERRNSFCSPLKPLNYLAAGIPVVSNIDCEIPALLDKAIFYTDTAEEMLEIIGQLSEGNKIVDDTAAASYINTNTTEWAVNLVFDQLSK